MEVSRIGHPWEAVLGGHVMEEKNTTMGGMEGAGNLDMELLKGGPNQTPATRMLVLQGTLETIFNSSNS